MVVGFKVIIAINIMTIVIVIIIVITIVIITIINPVTLIGKEPIVTIPKVRW